MVTHKEMSLLEKYQAISWMILDSLHGHLLVIAQIPCAYSRDLSLLEAYLIDPSIA